MKNNLIKNIVILLSYFFYEFIIICILGILGIDISKLNFLQKNIYLFIVDGIYLIGLIWLYRKELKEEIKDFKNNGSNYILKYAPLYLIGVIVMGVTNSILFNITGMEVSTNEQTVRTLIKYYPIYMTFSSVIYAPIVEELIFRKSIKKFFNNGVLFVLVSGIMFGLIHVISTGNESLNELLMGIPYIIIGIDIAYIYYKTKNIFTTIIIHSMHNLTLLILQFIGG